MTLRWTRALLLACIGIAVFFRFRALDHLPGVNGDEAYLGTKAWLTLHGGSMPLRTNSGMIPDPISLGLSWLVHLFVNPSPWALRLPVAITGVLAIVAVFFIARRLWGREAGLLAAAFTACLPPHIMNSRFLWESPQTPLVCALWLFAAFSGSVFYVALAGALALLVHPTNIFLLPMVGIVMLFRFDRWRERMTEWRAHPWRTAAAAAVLVALGVWMVPYMTSRGGNPTAMLDRLSSVAELGRFLVLLPGVVMGSATYQYLVGPVGDGALTSYRFAYLAIFVLPVVFSLISDWRRLGVEVLGFCASLTLFYVVAGRYAVSPATERYAFWMTIPHVMIAARAWIHLWRDARLMPAVIAVAICAAALVDVNKQYFTRLQVNNSVTENTFKTADIEPKLQAVRFIETQVDPARRTRIFCEDWWTYWAVRYFSLGKSPAWEVTMLSGRPTESFPAEVHLPDVPPETRKIFYVGYTSWRFTGNVLKRSPGAVEHAIGGYGGVVILSVFTAK